MRIICVAGIVLLLIGLLDSCGATSPPADHNGTSVAQAFDRHSTNVRVEGDGVVTRVLSDDTAGLPHQRFIVNIGSGQTVLIEHNTDVAPRISDLSAGDAISFAGEYVWNEQGGLVHWTHHDPAGRHAAGWLKHKGRTYQ